MERKKTMAAVDYFLKIDGVPGESKDAKHKGAIQLSSWAWSARNTGTMRYGGGGGGGRAVFRDFRFTMPASAATPKVMQKLASGEHIPGATLICRRAGTPPHEYLKITFENVIIARYETLGGYVEDALPLDAVWLNFAKITYEYREQRADGSLSGAVVASYDMQPLLGVPDTELAAYTLVNQSSTSVRPADVLMEFTISKGRLEVLAGSNPTLLLKATSGRKGESMNNPDYATQPFKGPLPPGEYFINVSEINVPSFARAVGRTLFEGDWGSFRVRIHAAQGTNTYGRDRFFLHGGILAGSAGCIDVGGGLLGDDNVQRLLEYMRADRDGVVSLTVRR